jgi:hypothetical protein
LPRSRSRCIPTLFGFSFRDSMSALAVPIESIDLARRSAREPRPCDAVFSSHDCSGAPAASGEALSAPPPTYSSSSSCPRWSVDFARRNARVFSLGQRTLVSYRARYTWEAVPPRTLPSGTDSSRTPGLTAARPTIVGVPPLTEKRATLVCEQARRLRGGCQNPHLIHIFASQLNPWAVPRAPKREQSSRMLGVMSLAAERVPYAG